MQLLYNNHYKKELKCIFTHSGCNFAQFWEISFILGFFLATFRLLLGYCWGTFGLLLGYFLVKFGRKLGQILTKVWSNNMVTLVVADVFQHPRVRLVPRVQQRREGRRIEKRPLGQKAASEKVVDVCK